MPRTDRLNNLVQVARELFSALGYDYVGMRQICMRAGLSPVQAYRLGLSKSDLLAEVSIDLTNKQLDTITQHIKSHARENVFAFTQRYLTQLYASDIEHIAIRKESAAYGWMWSNIYEQRIVGQVMQILAPIHDLLTRRSYDNVEARCLGIWSLYYVGFRSAVTAGANPEDCFKYIGESVRLLLKR